MFIRRRKVKYVFFLFYHFFFCIYDISISIYNMR